jgi:hypothetical protein
MMPRASFAHLNGFEEEEEELVILKKTLKMVWMLLQ